MYKAITEMLRRTTQGHGKPGLSRTGKSPSPRIWVFCTGAAVTLQRRVSETEGVPRTAR